MATTLRSSWARIARNRRFALLVVVAVAGCSDGGHRQSAASTTAPSSLAATASSGGGHATSGIAVSLPGSPNATQDVTFPPRNEPFNFRRDVLEPKYRDDLRRPLQNSFVDIEGTIVWTQEYLRYRVNGCSHADAVSRVFSQIDGQGIAPVCVAVTGNPIFPPRNEPFDFRQRLEAKYRDELRRTAVQTAVDIEGDIVWTQEYLRYRVSSCSHTDAVDKVIAQIDGRGVQPDCMRIDCTYAMSPTFQRVGSNGGTFSAAVSTTAGCTWQLRADASWLSGIPGSGAGPAGFSYGVAANPAAAARSARITLSGQGGSAALDISQDGTAPATCSYQVSPASVNVAAGGGTFDVNVSTSAGCAWNAASQSSFISLVSGGSGNGSGTARFSASANSGAARSGSVRVTGTGFTQDVSVQQAGGVAAPVARIVDPRTCAVNTTCNFDGSQSQGTITQWQWNFGDGTTGSGPLVNKVYPTSFVPQQFSSRVATVTLTVIGPGGSSTTTSNVTITRSY